MMSPPALTPSTSEYLRKLVFEGSAIVLDNQKDYLLMSRLAPLLQQERCTTWESFVDRLRDRSSSHLRKKVVEAMTTHETSFFRDGHPFETLRTHVLPRIARDKPRGASLHIWSAAASSGQEIYSIAMLLRQMAPHFTGWDLRLLGTDLSEDILARAKEACYSQLEVNRGVPPNLLTQWFVREGVQWRLKPELRKMVEYRVLNLIEPLPALPQMDLVFLRNVLIYFDNATKRMILERIAGAMCLGGVLFLGGVETTLHLSDRFTEEVYGKTVMYRRTT